MIEKNGYPSAESGRRSSILLLFYVHFKEEDLRKKINCVIVNPGAILSIKRKKRSNTTDDKCQSPIKKHNLDEIVSVVEADTSNSQIVANIVTSLILDSPTTTKTALIEVTC